jgi:adenine specific DNA methylase Mod
VANSLYFGDNLDILRGGHIPDESVDLIYLDPPFNSQARYNLLFPTPPSEAPTAQAGAFKDSWDWGSGEADWAHKEVMRQGGAVARLVDALFSALGRSDMMAYLVMMAVRLHELHRKLKPTGAMYLHCDPTASHYLKIILDGIFGPDKFLNEIVWKRTSAHSSAKRYGAIHDTILFYSASNKFTWNVVYGPYDEQYTDAFFTHKDEQGRPWRRTDMTGPGTRKGDSGLPWRHFNPTERGRHWQPPSYFYEKYTELTGGDLAEYPLIQRLEKLDELGLIHWPAKEGGMPQGKRLLEDAKGVPLQDVWTDIRPIHNTSSERVGYPTQKPLELLTRILEASTVKGDVVLDPFCGCGTTIEAAEKLGRRWIGIDIAIHAIKVIESRVAGAAYKVEGIPRDFPSAVALAEKDKYLFQWWANYLFNPHALREQKRGADQGVDGELFFPNGPGRPWGRMLTSVKGGANVGVKDIREFGRVLEREKAEMGLFISLYEPTKPMMNEAAGMGTADTVHGEIPRLQIVAIEKWFAGKFPRLPPLEHLPSAAFSTTRRRAVAMAAKTQAPQHPQLPLVFAGGKTAGIVHFNRAMVTSQTDAEVSGRRKQKVFALR